MLRLWRSIFGGTPRFSRNAVMIGTRQPAAGHSCWPATWRPFSQKWNTGSLGGAFGIDAAARAGALDAGGKTIAVLAGGLDRLHPREHALFRKNRRTGPWSRNRHPGHRHNWRFPVRNRLMAALGSELILVQAPLRSGTHSTVVEALALGREVRVCPWSPECVEGAGCMQLAGMGAELIVTGRELSDHVDGEMAQIESRGDEVLCAVHAAILQGFADGDLVALTGLPVETVMTQCALNSRTGSGAWHPRVRSGKSRLKKIFHATHINVDFHEMTPIRPVDGGEATRNKGGPDGIRTDKAERKILVIVESPTKANTISKSLGKEYIVEASMGHVIDLPKSRMAVNVENGFEPDYITVRGRGKVLNTLKRLAGKSKEVLLAADEDREGEAISFHLMNELTKKYPGLPINRIVFHEITPDVIREAAMHPVGINMPKVMAQKARRVLDRLVGYNISPILWEKVKKGLSAGRSECRTAHDLRTGKRSPNLFRPNTGRSSSGECRSMLWWRNSPDTGKEGGSDQPPGG